MEIIVSQIQMAICSWYWSTANT